MNCRTKRFPELALLSISVFFLALSAGTANAANHRCQVGAITPSNGNSNSNQAVLFTTTYTDADGYADIKYAYFLVNTSTSQLNCFSAYYDSAANKLYIYNDSETIWMGGYAPGSVNVIENDRAILDCSKTTVSGLGTKLTITWAVTFKPWFGGNKNTYLAVAEPFYKSGWVHKGHWKINNDPPQATSITPASGSSAPDQYVTFRACWTDPNGAPDITKCYFLVNTASSGFTKCLYVYYKPSTNTIYLAKDSGRSWTSAHPGSSKILQNSYVRIDCSKSVSAQTAFYHNVDLAVSFKQAFSGQKKMYLMTIDKAKAGSGWVEKGAWTIGPGTLSISVSPSEWNIGAVAPNSVKTMTQASKMTIINDGTAAESLDLKLVNPPDWVAGPAAGEEQYTLGAIICGIGNVPADADFNAGFGPDDLLTVNSQKATGSVFGYGQSAGNGSSIAPGDSRALYLQFKSPVRTSSTAEKNISIIVNCQTS